MKVPCILSICLLAFSQALVSATSTERQHHKRQHMHREGTGRLRRAKRTLPEGRTSSARTSSNAAKECKLRHPALLETIGSELAHLQKRGVNASSLDKVHWPLYKDWQRKVYAPDDPDGKKDTPFFQIYHGKLYAHRDAFIASSQKDVPYGWGEYSSMFLSQVCKILKQVPDLPSMRLMVNNEDQTEVFNDWPVFVEYKVRGGMPIAYPAGDFSIQDFHEPPWNEKLNKAFFAGSGGSGVRNANSSKFNVRAKRDELQALFERDPESRELMDIHVNLGATGDGTLRKYTYDDIAQRRYQIVMDGESARATYSTYLSMNSLVFKPESPYYEYFEPALKAYEHFVPVNLTDIDSTKWDLKEKISWAREHDAVAQRIAENGSRFAKDHLGDEGSDCYFLELLLQYHDLMHFDDTLPVEFASSPDICKSDG